MRVGALSLLHTQNSLTLAHTPTPDSIRRIWGILFVVQKWAEDSAKFLFYEGTSKFFALPNIFKPCYSPHPVLPLCPKLPDLPYRLKSKSC